MTFRAEESLFRSGLFSAHHMDTNKVVRLSYGSSQDRWDAEVMALTETSD